MVRINITISDDLAAYLKSVQNKSQYVVMAVQEKIKRDASKKARLQLAKAYVASAKEDLAVDLEWSGTLKDGCFNS